MTGRQTAPAPEHTEIVECETAMVRAIALKQALATLRPLLRLQGYSREDLARMQEDGLAHVDLADGLGEFGSLRAAQLL